MIDVFICDLCRLRGEHLLCAVLDHRQEIVLAYFALILSQPTLLNDQRIQTKLLVRLLNNLEGIKLR